MKRIIYISLIVLIAAGCAKDGERHSEMVAIEGVGVEMDLNSVRSRAVINGRRYVVNTTDDPTYNNIVAKRAGWYLDVDLTPTDEDPNPGRNYEATFEYDANKGYWRIKPFSTEESLIWLPNYKKRKVKAVLYPGDSGTDNSGVMGPPYLQRDIARDQSDEDKILNEDILEQPGLTTNITPAKVLEIPVRHKYAMLDFVIEDVMIDDIESLYIQIQNTVGEYGEPYLPYRAIEDKSAKKLECLLIMPLEVTDFRVVLKTKREHITYYQNMNIAGGSIVNTCYCTTFKGLDLTLVANSISSWINGEAQSGNYTTVVSYPTFKWYPDETLIVWFDTGLSQELEFNQLGELTVKPDGRTIIKIVSAEDPETDLLEGKNPIVMGNMFIDLKSYLN